MNNIEHTEEWLLQELNKRRSPSVFADIEHEMSKYPKTAYQYANRVLHGAFKLGEPAIATKARESYWYSTEVLVDRFKLGEYAIAQDPYYAMMYAVHHSLKFELGEQAIASTAYTAYMYALYALYDRFELGELTMQENIEYYTQYLRHFNRRDTIYEDILIRSGNKTHIDSYADRVSMRIYLKWWRHKLRKFLWK